MIYFVATPIGNLKDITLRALDTLRAADAIFCEDTRHTLKLLTAYEIKKPLYACHKFNEREAAEKILMLSRDGKEVCIVSDAGMPVVSDPVSEIVKMLKEAAEPFTVLPGANAALCALLLSGLPSDRFTFVGFLPDKKGERVRVLQSLLLARETLIFHCAPQDVDDYIALMFEAFGNRRAAAVREITKLYEESVSFTLEEGLRGEKRGEYVLVVEGAAAAENPLCKLPVREHVLYYMNAGCNKKEALKRTAKDRGITKSDVYKETLDIK